MKNIFLLISLLTTIVLFVQCTQSEREEQVNNFPNENESVQSSEVELPLKFKNLLKEEMVQIQDAMKRLVPLLASGNMEAADLGLKIHKSFILKQSLSSEELQELISLLPEDFVELDRTFHADAKKLSEAVSNNEFINAGKIYGKMLSGCIQCHSHYAGKVFPEFTKPDKNHKKGK